MFLKMKGGCKNSKLGPNYFVILVKETAEVLIRFQHGIVSIMCTYMKNKCITDRLSLS